MSFNLAVQRGRRLLTRSSVLFAAHRACGLAAPDSPGCGGPGSAIAGGGDARFQSRPLDR